MVAPSEPGSRVLIVFARVPQRGRVKTRLAAAVGEDKALDAYRTMLRDTLATCASLPHARVLMCIDGDDVEGECAALARRYGTSIAVQSAENLGERMHRALAQQLGEGRTPVLVGCDCPPLALGDLAMAFDALRSTDAVFAPTEDGGYSLVGMRRVLPGAFAGVRWGSGSVMRTTRDRLRALGASWSELRTLWDVDDEAGYLRWLGWRSERVAADPTADRVRLDAAAAASRGSSDRGSGG